MQLRVLGPLELVGSNGVVPLGGAKVRALLALLAHHAGDSVSEERLIEVLWGDSAPRTATKTLQSYVSRLRRALAEGEERLGIETTPGGYRLRAAIDVLDIARVEALAVQAREATERDEHAWAAVALSEALRTWRGVPLEEFAGEPWAAAESARLVELREVLVEEQVDAELACGRHAALIPQLELLTAQHPLRERLWGQRMIALYRSGRQADALRVFQQVRTLLADELGIEPSHALRKLEQQILDQDRALDAPPPGPVPATPSMPTLPSGVVTFLLTDIEGSTALWDADPVAMAGSLARHAKLIEDAVETWNGVLLKARGEGDSTFSVFTRASDAIGAAHRLHTSFDAEPWPEDGRLRVRVALHTGEALEQDGDYFGPTVNRCARILSLGNGGQVLASAATVQVSGAELPAGAEWVDLGQHGLRDIADPEHVYELGEAGQRTASRPLRAPSRIPLASTPLVGREQEIEDIGQLLRDHRLVVLTGVGGVGKTRLALEIASRAPIAYFCDLSVVSDDVLVPSAASTAVGAPPGDDQPRSFLAGSDAMLVLDNCEHLLDACAELARHLIARCPRVRILATSREALGLDGEHDWPVPSLADDAALELFEARAKAVRPSFVLSDADRPAVAEVCRRLDGIPLAIELAAAHVSHLSPGQLAERLDDRLRLLTGGKRRASRQQTLGATMDWSYRLLQESEQRLLRRLSVFAGAFGLEAAEAICADEVGDVLTDIGSLVAKSLVVAEEHANAIRYRLLETVRAYAQDRLVEADEVVRIRDRHRDWYVDWVERFAPDERLASLSAALAVEHDYPNLTAAMTWALAQDRHDLLGRIVAASASLWRFSFRELEGFQWAEAALDSSERLDPDTRVACHSVAAFAAMLRTDNVSTWRHARAATEVPAARPTPTLAFAWSHRAINDASAAMQIRLGLDVHDVTADNASALEALALASLERARDVARACDSARTTALIEGQAGLVHAILGRLDEAIDLFEQAQAASIGDDYFQRWTYPTSMAVALWIRGDDARARQAARRVMKHLGTGSLGSWSADNAAIAVALDPDEARTLLDRAFREAFESGVQSTIADCVIGAAAVIARDHPCLAGQMLAAANAWREREVLPFRTPWASAVYIELVQRLRAALGPETARRVRDEGRALGVADAIERIVERLGLDVAYEPSALPS